MTKKKYSDEYGNQIRSRPSKPFYKKWLVWVIVILGVLFGAIGIYTLGSKEEAADYPFEKGEETVIENPELADSKEENAEEQAYTYEDFKGIYVIFSGEPYKTSIKDMSDIIVVEDDYYQRFNRWDFDMTSTIKDKKIEGNVLTLDLDSDENEMWGLHSESGTEQFELRHEGDKKILYSVTNDDSFYSMSNQDLQTHYTQSEIDYARIIMTIYGELTLDQWAMWEDEWGVPVVDVIYNSAGDPTEVSDEVPYPNDVTHLSLTNQGMAAGIITYSSHGDGTIVRYPMPLHYHQEDQSEEGYRQLAQESLDDAEAMYIEPFEPYTVADFIGRVEFLYE
ncbi:hypothetical protein [Halolactibacillus sp. JCM 19043]|uniref:hypothetical protein n=1 Tax=Halolactibacillus sp. JCM 19043 TaxID=1460638 RepID=UPI000782E5B2|nr:hypothetical protein [Halolactibacillus sp. JCM 19043]